jgi:uncharacterized membrane protein YhhN
VQTSGWVALALAVVCSAVDWYAVARHLVRLERIFKPAVIVMLIGVALLSEPDKGSVRALVVFALIWGLIGDVALMLEHEPDGAPERPPAIGGARFIVGLSAFLIGHIGYALAMYLLSFDWLGAGMGAVLALLILLAFGLPILRGARAKGGLRLATAVAAYMLALGALLVCGIATSKIWVAYGAIVFVTSDLILGANRFVRPHPLARLAVVITYHSAQVLLVVGLVS